MYIVYVDARYYKHMRYTYIRVHYFYVYICMFHALGNAPRYAEAAHAAGEDVEETPVEEGPGGHDMGIWKSKVTPNLSQRVPAEGRWGIHWMG